MSRTPDDDGRRLVLTSPPRAWGWRIVNFHAYRERARLAAKSAREVEEGRNRQRMEGRTAADRRSPPLTAADPLSNANANSNTDKKQEARKRAALPPDFGLTESREAYAKAKLPNVDTAELLESFRDYHAKEGTVAKDWEASWRTWVRNALQFGYPMVKPTAKQAVRVIRRDANGREIHD